MTPTKKITGRKPRRLPMDRAAQMACHHITSGGLRLKNNPVEHDRTYWFPLFRCYVRVCSACRSWVVKRARRRDDNIRVIEEKAVKP